MTVTLEIPAEIESVLSAKAELFGLALPEYIFSLCEMATDDEYSLSVEEIASVQQGLAEIESDEPGMLLEDYRAEVMAEYHRETAEVMAKRGVLLPQPVLGSSA